jgi:hypothetical protein
METIDGNKLIAEFMGIRRGHKYLDLDVSVEYQFELLCSASELQFNLSWDWLMPVVEKISKNYVYYQSNDSGKWQILIDIASINIVSENLLEAVWRAIVEFIQWNNKHN